MLTLYRWVSRFLFDPWSAARAWRVLPLYLRNRRRWNALNQRATFAFQWREAFFCTTDSLASAGNAKGHYFWQDLWAAEEIMGSRPPRHVDVGSRIDGFIAHLLPNVPTSYVDIRPIELVHRNFQFVEGSVLALPFADQSVPSLSCLHVIEHIGLGRYGDPVDPEGFTKAAGELARVLAPGGRLLIGTPVGTERLCFDAHRVFDPATIVAAFATLKLESFHLIDDQGRGIRRDVSLDEGRKCRYGCGLFIFTRSNPHAAS